MTAAWAAVIVSAIMMVGAFSVALIRSGRHEGRLEAILDRLETIVADHEKRLRKLQKRR